MNLKNTFSRLALRFSRKPKFLNEPRYRIIQEFVHNGIVYYRHEDVFNTPCVRALSSIQYYEELQMRMTREFLLEDIKAHETINANLKKVISGSGGQLNLVDAVHLLGQSNVLIKQKKERLEWIFEPESLYKLAAVVYFDSSENPMQYDSRYAQKKIERWKENNTEMLDFFLQQPILRFAPSFKELNTDFHLYLEALEQVNNEHLEKISQFISNKN